jgi:hypothetical protein
MKTEHRIKSPTLSGVCTVIEQPNRIVFRLRWQDEPPEHADEVFAWLLPIAMRYKDDPRGIAIDGAVCAEDQLERDLTALINDQHAAA